ncbi:MAG: hypothetical protein IKF51_04715 [Solobacterium sp.]|nr:hypothetical protein [Solobacterium sp.]
MKRYQDMLDLPHHVSKTRKRMSGAERAAQFAPFSALTGYEELIAETGRLTDGKKELGETQREILDQRIRILQEAGEGTAVAVTVFVPDEYKEGGRYEIRTGILKKIEETERCIRFMDGTRIRFEDIYGIEAGLFPDDE